MSTRTNLIAALLHMLNKGPAYPKRGVCLNVFYSGQSAGIDPALAVTAKCIFARTAMRIRLYASWTLWSGCKTYPIPHTTYLPKFQPTADNRDELAYVMADSAYNGLPKWSGPQLHLRRDFLYHCVKQLRKMSDAEVEAML